MPGLLATLVPRLLLLLAVLVGLTVGLLALAPARAQDDQPPYVTLEGRAVLPADTFAAGPPSGFAIAPDANTNGRSVPFDNQPVQGVSSVIPKWNGNYLVMSDNGFGSKANSPDYRLRWYEMRLDFSRSAVDVVGFTELSDPDTHIPWPIVNSASDRVLTGADFDLEAFRQAPDGTFWFGEEFGPFLLHVDAQGRLLEPPYPTPYPEVLAPFARGRPYIQAAENPDFFGLPRAEQVAAANHPTSRGFEGMAISPDGSKLYPLLEGALIDDEVPTRLLLLEFDLASKAYTGRYWFYPVSDPSHAIGELTSVGDEEFIVIERDSRQGAESVYKRIYRFNLGSANETRTVSKRLIVDLLNITDNKGITAPEAGAIGLGPVFSFPFITIESVYPLGSSRLLVANDNNYPFSTGRRPDQPDDNEFILLRLYPDG